MKYQALFSLKDKNKKFKCCLLQFLFGALRVKSKSVINFDIHKKIRKIGNVRKIREKLGISSQKLVF